VAITCSGAPTGQLTGALAIYDEDVGQLVAQVSALGLQPFGVTVDRRGNGAGSSSATSAMGESPWSTCPSSIAPRTPGWWPTWASRSSA